MTAWQQEWVDQFRFDSRGRRVSEVMADKPLPRDVPTSEETEEVSEP